MNAISPFDPAIGYGSSFMFGRHRDDAAELSIAWTTRRSADAAGSPRKISHRAAPSGAVTSAPKITWLSGEIEGTPISENVPPPGASSPTVAIFTIVPPPLLAQVVEVRSVLGATLSGSGPRSVSVIALACGAASIIVIASATAYRYRRKIITEILITGIFRGEREARPGQQIEVHTWQATVPP